MKQEEIQQAARLYSDEALARTCAYTDRIYERRRTLSLFDASNIEQAFEAGAEWRINSVWHDAREEPIKEKGRWLAFCGGIKVFMCEEWHGQFLWSGYVSMLGIVAWAYVDDLLPMKGGENEND